MKLAIATSPKKRKFAAVPLQGPIEEILPLARSLGFEGVELNMGNPNEVDLAQLQETLKRTGLQVVSITTGAAYIEEGLCLSADTQADRQKAIERIKRQCDAASRIGSMVIIGMLRGRLDSDPDRARQQRDWFGDSLNQCASEARSLGVTLIVEPMNRYETNFLRTAEETLGFLDGLGRNEVMLVLDTFHMNIEERDLPRAFAAAIGRIGLVQTVESNRCAPGMGHIDFAAILRTLQATGYEGYLSAEILPEPDGASAGRAAAAHLTRLLGDLPTA